MVNIKFIIGSNRPNRFGPKPAAWLMSLAEEYKNQATFEIADVQALNLPFLDEPELPSMGNYVKDHTKAWAKAVDESDGFVFITPEYNHSYPAALKNAIDFVGREWNHKPAAFLSYGAGAGGARAVEHLRGVVSQLGMYDLSTQVAIVNAFSQIDEDGNFAASERQVAEAKKMLERLIFWAEHMKAAREDLAKA